MEEHKNTIVITNDGSPTLHSGRFGQNYHNIAGALTESRHTFFDRTGIIRALAAHRDITICETGFGTGMHVLLLEKLRNDVSSRSHVRYFSVEKYPVNGALIRELDYNSRFAGMNNIVNSVTRFCNDIYASKPGSTNSMTLPLTKVSVFHGDFYDWELFFSDKGGKESVDFFLHDAFSPAVNPELWTPDAFKNLMGVAADGAMLGTYCSAVRARAAMVLAGWHVARAAGPPGKREMSLASPDEVPLKGYKRINEKRLQERFREVL